MKKSQTLIFLSILIVAGLVSLKEQCANILLFALAFAIIGFLLSRAENLPSGKGSQLFDGLFLYGYALRVLTCILFFYFLTLSYGEPFLGGGDDESFHKAGQAISEGWIAYGFGYSAGAKYWIYDYINALFHYFSHFFGDYHVLLVRFLNAFVGALIPIYLYKTAYFIYGDRIARSIAWAALLFPELIFYSSVQVRDIMIAFLFVYSFSCFLEYFFLGRFRRFLFMSLALLALFSFRRVYAVDLTLVFILAFILFSFGIKTGGGFKHRGWNKYLAVIIVLTLLILLNTGVLLKVVHPSSESFLDTVKRYRIHSFYQHAGKDDYASQSLAFRLYVTLPPVIRDVSFPILMILNPYPPWYVLLQENYRLAFFNFAAGTAWILIVPFLFIGLLKSLRYHLLLSAPLIVAFVSIIVLCSTSYWSARYRLPVMPFALALTVFGIHKIKELPWIKLYFFGFHFLLLSTYLVLKYDVFPVRTFVCLLCVTVASSILIIIVKEFELGNLSWHLKKARQGAGTP